MQIRTAQVHRFMRERDLAVPRVALYAAVLREGQRERSVKIELKIKKTDFEN